MSDCGHDHHCHHHHHYYGGGSGGSGGDGSGIITIISMVASLFIIALFNMLLGIEADDIPSFLLAIVWIGMSFGIAMLIDKLR